MTTQVAVTSGLRPLVVRLQLLTDTALLAWPVHALALASGLIPPTVWSASDCPSRGRLFGHAEGGASRRETGAGRAVPVTQESRGGRPGVLPPQAGVASTAPPAPALQLCVLGAAAGLQGPAGLRDYSHRRRPSSAWRPPRHRRPRRPQLGARLGRLLLHETDSEAGRIWAGTQRGCWSTVPGTRVGRRQQRGAFGLARPPGAHPDPRVGWTPPFSAGESRGGRTEQSLRSQVAAAGPGHTRLCPQAPQTSTSSGRRTAASWTRPPPRRPTRCSPAGPTRSAGCGTPWARAPSTAAPSSPPRATGPPVCGSPSRDPVSAVPPRPHPPSHTHPRTHPPGCTAGSAGRCWGGRVRRAPKAPAPASRAEDRAGCTGLARKVSPAQRRFAPVSAGSARGLPGPLSAWSTLTPRCLQAWPGPWHREACPFLSSERYPAPLHVLGSFWNSPAKRGTAGHGMGPHAASSQPWRPVPAPSISGRLCLLPCGRPRAQHSRVCSVPTGAHAPASRCCAPLRFPVRPQQFPLMLRRCWKGPHPSGEGLGRENCTLLPPPEPGPPISVKWPPPRHRQGTRTPHVSLTHKPRGVPQKPRERHWRHSREGPAAVLLLPPPPRGHPAHRRGSSRT